MDGVVVVVDSHEDFTASSGRRAAVDEYLLWLLLFAGFPGG